MFQTAEAKRLYSVKAAILVIAVFAAFAFSIIENSGAAEAAGNVPYSSSIFAPVNHAVDWLAEDTHTVSRAGRAASGAAQNGLLLSFELNSNGGQLICFAAHTAKPVYTRNDKNIISVKLRI